MSRDSNDCYYKILKNSRTGKYCVVCLQWFDEYDYDQDKFLCDKDGEQIKFWEDEGGEQKAKEFLNKVIKPEFIDDDDIIPNNEHMFKIPIDEWEK